MTVELRPYQVSFIKELRHQLSIHNKIIGCAATGSGKSKVFISIANSALAKGRSVLIISESTKIYDQIAAEIKCENINAGKKPSKPTSNQCYLAMAQTLTRRKYMIDEFAKMGNNLLLIVDECHISTPTKIIKAIPDAYLLGFTATPDFRTSKHLPELYNHCVIGPQPDELVTEGFLSPYRHFTRVSANMSQLELRGGEFTEESQEIVFRTEEVVEALSNDLKTIKYKKALIFTSSIKHCEELYNLLKIIGFNCTRVHSKLSAAEESYNMQSFTKGDIPICINVGVLTKGFDFPLIDLVILHRATTSLPLFLQMIGRGSRICAGKEYFSVLDYGANYLRHGLWDEERDWATMWKMGTKKKKEGIAPVKNCPKCQYICHASAKECPNCGEQFIKEEEDEEDDERESILIEVNEMFRKLSGRNILSLDPSELSLYAKAKKKVGYACRVAMYKDGITPGFMSAYAKCMGYKEGWLWFQKKRLAGQKIIINDFTLR